MNDDLYCACGRFLGFYQHKYKTCLSCRHIAIGLHNAPPVEDVQTHASECRKPAIPPEEGD